MFLAHHGEVYGRAYGDWPYMYWCPSCGAHVGVHPRTDIPLGTLADRFLRDARKSCKAVFIELAQSRGWDRNASYQWLAQALGIAASACHFGLFEMDDCQRVAALCRAELERHAQ